MIPARVVAKIAFIIVTFATLAATLVVNSSKGSQKRSKDHGPDYDPCHGPNHVYYSYVDIQQGLQVGDNKIVSTISATIIATYILHVCT